MSAIKTVDRANRVQALTIETTVLVSTSFLSNLRASRKRPVSIGVSQADLMLFFNGFFSAARSDSAKHAKTGPVGWYSLHGLGVK
jgi:hypothetical protein